MAISIDRSDLLSEVIRRGQENLFGTRSINLVGSLTDVNADDGEGGSFLEKFWRGLSKFSGFVVGSISNGGKFSFSAAWGWITARLQELWVFDWNQSDAELKQAIQSYNIQIASAWGGVVGQGLGYIASIGLGAGIALFIPVIGGKALAASILASAGKEALEELVGSIRTAIGTTVSATIAKTLLGAYMNFRSWLKSGAIDKWLPEKAVKWIKDEWGNTDAPELSFSKIVEDKVESIKNPVTRAFVEELLEEAWDGFVEGGYLVSGEMDAALARYHAASQQERNRIIELQPDRDNPDEKLVFYGDDNRLIPAVQTALNIHQLIHSRDIGFMDEAEEIIPATIRQERTLKVYFYNQPRPPFVRKGITRRLRKIAIPNPKPGLTWKDIKNACGAEAGLAFGSKYYATARMDSRRKMVIYGISEESAISNLKRLADLSEDNILEIRPGNIASSKQHIRPPETFWGAYLHASLEIANAGNNEDIEGKKSATVRQRIKLWTPNSPEELSTSSIYQHLRSKLGTPWLS